MTREQWLIEAKYLFHSNMPTANSKWVDEVAEALCTQFGDLEPDEAVAMFVVTQVGAASGQATVH